MERDDGVPAMVVPVTPPPRRSAWFTKEITLHEAVPPTLPAMKPSPPAMSAGASTLGASPLLSSQLGYDKLVQEFNELADTLSEGWVSVTGVGVLHELKMFLRYYLLDGSLFPSLLLLSVWIAARKLPLFYSALCREVRGGGGGDIPLPFANPVPVSEVHAGYSRALKKVRGKTPSLWPPLKLPPGEGSCLMLTPGGELEWVSAEERAAEIDFSIVRAITPVGGIIKLGLSQLALFSPPFPPTPS